MASGSAPCSEQRSSTGKAEKSAVGRGRRGTVMNPLGTRHCEVCVVCGDAACNHHYYGVPSCHGCKCFFWRSIKNKMKYICRADGHCDINPNFRNACRYCRLQRCLKAGMQPEAVRMPKNTLESEDDLAKIEKEICKESTEFSVISPECCPLCNGKSKETLSIQNEDKKEISELPNKINNYIERTQKQLMDINEVKCQFLIKKLIEIEMTINEVVDFSENEAPKREMLLESIFEYPQILDRFRTQINYCVRLRRATEEEMEFCKYRTLTKVVDYINNLSQINLNNIMETSNCHQFSSFGEYLSVQDKIVLLRYGFASLALFDIAAGTISVTKDTQNLLCLPTGITLCAGETIVPNTFLTQQIINKCIGSLVKLLADLKLDQEEFILMKLIIVLGMDSASGEDNNNNNIEGITINNNQNNCIINNSSPQLLSINGRTFIEKLRDSAHSALYNHSPQKSSSSSSSSFNSSEAAALRFAKLLHILPKLTLISRDLIENIRMVHTFPSTRSRPTDPLFFDLFGDIFQPNKQQNNNNLEINNSIISSSSDLNEQQQFNEYQNNNYYFNNNLRREGIESIYHQKQELSDYEQQQKFKNDLISKTKRDVNNTWWTNNDI